MRTCGIAAARKTELGLIFAERMGSVSMLRQAFTDRLKEAMKARDLRTISTVRLILAGAERAGHRRARARQTRRGFPNAEIHRMLQGMIKQRRESIALYEQGQPSRSWRSRSARRLRSSKAFCPRQLDEGEIEAAARAAIAETGAASIKDLGKVMAALRERHAGVIDLGRAGAIVRRLLG